MIYPIEALLDIVELHHTKDDVAIFDGEPIKLGSLRYKTFKVKGTKCVSCGIEGSYFRKERGHMNLYTSDGKLMTRDHIIATSRGGEDTLENSQTMCAACNSKKGNRTFGQIRIGDRVIHGTEIREVVRVSKKIFQISGSEVLFRKTTGMGIHVPERCVPCPN